MYDFLERLKVDTMAEFVLLIASLMFISAAIVMAFMGKIKAEFIAGSATTLLGFMTSKIGTSNGNGHPPEEDGGGT